MSTNKYSKLGNEELSERALEMQHLAKRTERLRYEAATAGAGELLLKEIKLSVELHFTILCRALSDNDPTVRAVSYDGDFPQGYALDLGQALSNQNTHVSSMDILCTEKLLPSNEVGGMSPDAIAEYVNPLVQHLQRSAALRTVSIGVRDKENVARLILRACLQNRNIEELSIDLVRLPEHAFLHCGRLTSLKKFTFRARSFADLYSQQEIQQIGDAFRYFSSLTDLEVETGDRELPTCIFEGVRRAGCQLERLVLMVDHHDRNEFWTALAAMLHAMNQLKHLHLRDMYFGAESTAGLISAITGRQDSGLQTLVSELTLDDLMLNEEAKPLFLRFMRTRARPPQGGNTLVSPSTLKKLNIEYGRDEADSELSAKYLVSVLSKRQDHGAQSKANAGNVYYPTIGSQVESLSLSPCQLEYADFLNRLRKRAHQISLKELTLHLYSADIAPLAKCLACVDSLRSITVTNIVPHPLRRVFVALRENGNVQSANIKSSVASAVETKLVQAYCERNQLLGTLLKTSSCTAKPDSPDDTIAAARAEHQHAYGGKSFCPALWQATNHTPKAGPSKLLGSLLDLCESLASYEPPN